MTHTDTPSKSHVPALGAHVTPAGTTFRTWTTKAGTVHVVFYDESGNETERRPLSNAGDGLFEGTFEDVRVGARYKFDLDGETYPDPYARWLPEGVHGPAVVWDSTYEFRHDTPNVKREHLVIYELHVGTFTKEGTYRAAMEKLPYLRDLGVNCLEIMPLSSFPGSRGWGYDGVAHFAPYRHYGPPEDLQEFIDKAHELGLVVLLDIVFNHFGPDGNYLGAYSEKYLTDAYTTPWGAALDYSNPYMRRFALDCADHWLKNYRFDGFRLDATHAIYDEGDTHVLQELAEHVHAMGGGHFLFCEDERNNPDLVQEYRMDGVWADDFHHSVRVLLTRERDGYFAGYEPTVENLQRCIERGWLYEGQEWPLPPHEPRGRPAPDLPASAFVYCIQNHDQIGNRAFGDRLQEMAGTDGYHLASALLLFLPMTPLLFQGQEWMASTPFLYFSDHHGELGKLVTKGRREEFSHFEAFKNSEASDRVPDPQAESTFLNSKLDWQELEHAEHARTLGLYRELLRLRRDDPVLRNATRRELQVGSHGDVLWVRRFNGSEERVLLVNFGREASERPPQSQVNVKGFSVLWASKEVNGESLPPLGAVLLAGTSGEVS